MTDRFEQALADVERIVAHAHRRPFTDSDLFDYEIDLSALTLRYATLNGDEQVKLCRRWMDLLNDAPS